MGQQIDYRLQRLDRSRRTARQIQDQARSPDAAHRTAQRREARLTRSLHSHLLRDTFHQPVAHSAGRFRRHVARSDSRPARCHDQPSRPAQLNQFFLDRDALIGHYPARHYLKIAPLERFRHGGTGEVRLFTARARIADCQQRRGCPMQRRFRCRGGHLHPQPPRPAATRRAAAILPSAGLAYSES